MSGTRRRDPKLQIPQFFILAAGRGARAGGPKALAAHGEEGTLLEAHVRSIARRWAPWSISVAVQGEWLARCRRISDAVRWVAADPDGTPLSSLQAIWRASTLKTWAFVFPVDMLPAWEYDIFDRLWTNRGLGGCEAVVPSCGECKGHPALLAPRLRRQILALDPKRDRLDLWLRGRKVRVVEMPYPQILSNWEATSEFLAHIGRGSAAGPTLAIRSRRVVLPEGERAAVVVVAGERILEILPHDKAPSDCAVQDVDNLAVLPGLVDTHVHFNEPGRTEWEGIETGTRAAAAGGITTLVDMPLNSIPVTTTLAALTLKQRSARGKRLVDLGFWGGLVPGNKSQLAPMVSGGALGFKCFLIDSGIPEFPPVGAAELRAAIPILATLRVPLLVHAELACAAAPAAGNPRRYGDYLASRPRAWENEAVALLVSVLRSLPKRQRCRVHIVHLSSSEVLPLLREAIDEDLPLTAETCPHYLTFASEEVPEGATHFKCAPPIRERANRERLWQALDEGLISFVVSDHSPCVPELKRRDTGNFMQAWGGIAGLQFTLPAVWTAARARALDLSALARWLSEGPARFAGLAAKGAIRPGADADLAVFDPDAAWRPAPGDIHHRNKLTPYEGLELRGRVEMTFLRGRKVYDRGKFIGKPEGWQPLRESGPTGMRNRSRD